MGALPREKLTTCEYQLKVNISSILRLRQSNCRSAGIPVSTDRSDPICVGGRCNTTLVLGRSMNQTNASRMEAACSPRGIRTTVPSLPVSGRPNCEPRGSRRAGRGLETRRPRRRGRQGAQTASVRLVSPQSLAATRGLRHHRIRPAKRRHRAGNGIRGRQTLLEQFRQTEDEPEIRERPPL